jgi:hypothetical protein
VNATADLGRFAPEAWGLSMPLTVSYLRTGLDPTFLQGTDVLAGQLPGLRDTGSSRRRIGITLRKTTPSDNPIVGALIDGTSVRVSHISASDNTVTTSNRLDGIEAGVEVDRPVAPVEVGIVPGFLADALRWLAPRRLEESAFFGRLTDARLRLTPERIGLSTAYVGQESRIWRYERVLQSPLDLDVTPFESPRQGLEAGARVAFRPLESLTARAGVTTGRDVLDPDRATPVALERQALRQAATELGRMSLGWERDRVVTTDAAFRPVIVDWLRPTFSRSSRFGQRRDPATSASLADRSARRPSCSALSTRTAAPPRPSCSTRAPRSAPCSTPRRWTSPADAPDPEAAGAGMGGAGRAPGGDPAAQAHRADLERGRRVPVRSGGDGPRLGVPARPGPHRWRTHPGRRHGGHGAAAGVLPGTVRGPVWVPAPRSPWGTPRATAASTTASSGCATRRTGAGPTSR